MKIDTESIASMTDANRNFSHVARMADKFGSVTIFKNNRPKYRVIDVEQNPEFELTDEEKIDIIAKRVLDEYRPAFLELAK